jgi:hypothetical protein
MKCARHSGRWGGSQFGMSGGSSSAGGYSARPGAQSTITGLSPPCMQELLQRMERICTKLRGVSVRCVWQGGGVDRECGTVHGDDA